MNGRHPYLKSRQSFQRETANHKLTILRDDGVYRHLRCKDPDSGFYWFDVVTWPGHLYVGGDIDSYCFARIHDMFDFFGDGSKYSWGINPEYWAQKLTIAEQRREAGEVYSEDAFWRAVSEWARMRLDEEGWAEEMYPDLLMGALEREVRIDDIWGSRLPNNAQEAHELLDEFGWLFGETWEWSLRELDSHYLRACWAIVWAIEQYRLTVEPGGIAAADLQRSREAA